MSLRPAYPERNKKKGTHAAMTDPPDKLSEIMKQMSESVLRNPHNIPSSEAAHAPRMAPSLRFK